MQQKLLLVLLVASRKLRYCLQGHPVRVLSAYPLEKVLHSPYAVGRIAEWNIELQAFQLEFSTTRVIKGWPWLISWQSGLTLMIGGWMRANPSRPVTKRPTNVSCTSMVPLHDIARGL